MPYFVGYIAHSHNCNYVNYKADYYSLRLIILGFCLHTKEHAAPARWVFMTSPVDRFA